MTDKTTSAELLCERLRHYLPKVADILNVVKMEWGDSWTDWAQGIRDETTELMLAVEKDPAIAQVLAAARKKGVA